MQRRISGVGDDREEPSGGPKEKRARRAAEGMRKEGLCPTGGFHWRVCTRATENIGSFCEHSDEIANIEFTFRPSGFIGIARPIKQRDWRPRRIRPT